MKRQKHDAEQEDASYTEGRRRAFLSMLRHVLGELGEPEAGGARWVVERQEALAQLRKVCADHGDNDWDEDLHLGDIIEKHLAPYLTEEE